MYNQTLPEIPEHWNNNRKFFFKYMSFETAEIVLGDRTLRWSTPATLNDPYELHLNFEIAEDEEAIIKQTINKMWGVYCGTIALPADPNPISTAIALAGSQPSRMTKGIFAEEYGPKVSEVLARMRNLSPQLRDDILTLMKSSKLLCLTGTPTNSAMWTHYADQGRGVVLWLKSSLELDSPYGAARPVQYLDAPLSVFTKGMVSDIAAGIQQIDAEEAKYLQVYTKGADWAYEQEWRVYGGGHNTDAPFEDCPFKAGELHGVIVGTRMQPTHRDQIAILLQKYPNAELYEASLSKTEFRHEIVKI